MRRRTPTGPTPAVRPGGIRPPTSDPCEVRERALREALVEIIYLMPPQTTSGVAYSEARDIAREVLEAVPDVRGLATYVDPIVGGNPYPSEDAS